ncbi:hypothetical protein J3Q64DRAFT_1635381 [Phycomyces blakesleeanus]|uniref:PX domain-containing protein n=2 Tax=Phycomyces blakesleeanus TaxID=4837 RepID=A0A167R8P2_PHYB8|nr:hypothetical protein PHYBLDRAFT_105035 [Phycomyces blakesleeanus NRRL 1555(-)]OAD81114.1 hypothetical protein PHYBLDRAFT_105035 [Phycomyces blakesleeanus NRRL 1555(-)]|eukprot:XP_018299154.1 hypothetical protein PHYBLDRAFT_105035 [Phycomyces blakesleeanus NRRL 1555(-)]
MSISKNPHRLSYQSSCDCAIDRAIRLGNNYIFITGATRQADTPAAKSYIVYHIRVGDIETKHRYSDFESLQRSLSKLHPIIIVPPIPEKHSLASYAAVQTRVKDDLSMVEKRKRMLQTFLNKVARHPELGRDHVFHDFLDCTKIWTNVVRSPPLSTLPKNLLMMVLRKQQDNQIKILPVNLIPSQSTYTLKNPDPRFEQIEQTTFRIANYMTNHLDKSQRKVIRRLGELVSDYAEEGAAYGQLSLNETKEVSKAIRKIGFAVETSCAETNQMFISLEGEFSEPIQEHAQLAHIVKQVLRFRSQKHAQVELIESVLASKQKAYDNLQRIEEDSERLQQTMTTEEAEADQPPTITPEDISPEDYYSPVLQRNKIRPKRQWSGKPFQFFSAVGNTFSSILDVDPETTRRNQIEKTKDVIEKLQEALQLTRDDLLEASANIDEDLIRFQRQKAKDLRDMLLVYAKTHIRHCQKNKEAWQKARTEVDTIPSWPFPNK